MFKRIFCLAAAVIFSLSFFAACGNNINNGGDTDMDTGLKKKITDTNTVLYSNGQSDYKLVIPQGKTSNTDYEAYAAIEFNSIFRLAAGIDLEIITDAGLSFNPTAKYISIGNTTLFAESGITADRETLGINGYKINTKGNSVLISAYGGLGLLYGVYEFCEINLGYRYYAADEIKITDSATVTLKNFDYTDRPDFEARVAFSYETHMDGHNADRLRLTGNMINNFGGNWWSSLSDQSLVQQLIPEKRYKASNPGWFWRSPGTNLPLPQICYTTGLYDRYAFEKGDWGEDGYADGTHGLFWTLVYNLINDYIIPESDKTMFMLGMADNTQYCKCETCMRDYELYGRSGVMMRFVNAVADEVEAWRQANAPEREINLVTFAYLSFIEPPCKKDNGQYITDEQGKYVPVDKSVMARSNVVIRYAPIQANYMYNLMDRDHNPLERDAIIGWSSIAEKLCVWDYRVDFSAYIAPFPQWLSAYDNIKIYKDYGFIDIFHQGSRTTRSTPFARLDDYVRSRLLWNVNQSYEQLTEDFIVNYYKEGAETIRKYRKYLSIYYLTDMLDKYYDGDPHRRLTDAKWWPLETVLNIKRIFDEGYEEILPLKESNPVRYEIVKSRLDTESLFFRFMLLEHYGVLYTTNERIDMIDEFKSICQNSGFTIINGSEGKYVNDFIQGWLEKLDN